MADPIVAVVDNDLHRIMQSALTFEGFVVRAYERATETTLQALAATPPDLLICDSFNPPLGGKGLIAGLRRHHDVPVLIYSAWGWQLYWDMVKSGIWIDGYMDKPGSMARLAERVRTTLIHRDPQRFKDIRPRKPVIERGMLKLDPNTYACFWGATPVPLTSPEYLVLEELARRPGVVRSRDALLDAAYQDRVVDDRVIDSHIKAVRRSLQGANADSDLIETLYGVGYRMKAL